MKVEASQEQGRSTRDRVQEIARAEMMRRRRRLGNLTQEQESAIETLLLSAALKASEVIEPILQFYSQPPSLVVVAGLCIAPDSGYLHSRS
jgi:hypothetical protein